MKIPLPESEEVLIVWEALGELGGNAVYRWKTVRREGKLSVGVVCDDRVPGPVERILLAVLASHAQENNKNDVVTKVAEQS